MDEKVLTALMAAQAKGEPVALATITHTWGHSPREVGAAMVIYGDGCSLGTVGGGCGEAEVWRAALDALDSGRPTTYIVNLLDDYKQDEGAICGGKLEVFIEPLIPRKQAAEGEAAQGHVS